MIELLVNGRNFGGFTQISAKTSIDRLAGTFSVSVVVKGPTDLPIKQRDAVKILVNGNQVIDGFVERVNGTYDASSDNITFAGRDRTADVIDGQMGDKKDVKGPVSLKKLIQEALSDASITGIGVINNVADIKDFTSSDIMAPQIGQTVFDYIEQYAKKRQVFLITDGLGNILINRTSMQQISTSLVNNISLTKDNSENNIKSASWNYDDTKRMGIYKVISQENISATELSEGSTEAKTIVNKFAQVEDPEIRKTRFFAKVGAKPLNQQECKDDATWELAVRRARSFSYTATVIGHAHNDDIWRPNRLIRITDKRAGLNGIFLINSIEYQTSLDEGNVTQITVVEKDAYKLQAEASKFDGKTTTQGKGIQSNLDDPAIQAQLRQLGITL